jgi:lycopene beta-cyclase
VALADPDAEITIVDAGERPFGEHTWSFHDTDVQRADQEWLAPFVACRWDSQSVVFPNYSRSFACGYASLTSQQVLGVLSRQPRLNIVTGSRVTGLTATGLTFGSGERIEGDCVIDARGFEPSQALVLGYQKFVGIEVELVAPHGLAAPVIMDATVDQIDGYRFVYLLPLLPVATGKSRGGNVMSRARSPSHSPSMFAASGPSVRPMSPASGFVVACFIPPPAIASVRQCASPIS